MTTLANDRFLRALLREPVDVTPVWMMRQAGRYLPEYRATRERAGSFVKLMKTPELACEVTLQPIDRYPLDAAILFSDILTIPDAMGLGLHFVEGEGPKFEHPVRDRRAVESLGVPDPERQLSYVMDAVRLIRRELDARVPLSGFCVSPCRNAANARTRATDAIGTNSVVSSEPVPIDAYVRHSFAPALRGCSFTASSACRRLRVGCPEST